MTLDQALTSGPAFSLWLPGLIGLCVGLTTLALVLGRRPVLRARQAARPGPWPWLRPILLLFSPLAKRSLRPHERAALERDIQRAGFRHHVHPVDLRALQCFLVTLGLTLSGLLANLTDRPGWLTLLLSGLAGFCLGAWPRWWLRDRARARQQRMLRDLPFVLDMMTLCLEAGLHFQGAIQQAYQRGPPGPLRDELGDWLADVRAGMSRANALRALADRCQESTIRRWVHAMIQAESLGMSLGQVLRAQADQRRQDRFVRAEKRALQAPVKMLAPLILCIFPCTFLIIAFPVGVRLLALTN